MALAAEKSRKTSTSKGRVLSLDNHTPKNSRAGHALKQGPEPKHEKSKKATLAAELSHTFSEQRKEQKSREEILDTHMPLVRLVAERIHRRLPPGVDLGSLVHSGIVGLLEALERYDERRGVAFQTYARYRIQGEIMEYLRSLDWVSRSVRAWGRKMAVARTRLAGRLGREASPEEMAVELGVPLTEYYRVDQKVSEATLLSLEDLTPASEEEWRKTQEEIGLRSFQDPFSSVEGKELVEKLTSAIGTLPERERLVVTLYYHEELTLREIGEILGLTEGRICQIHTQAVTRLQGALGAKEEKRASGERNFLRAA
ncbi:MAG: FliA/WhiG family RNA polymerase sigma factor [Candidatus Binatia bacterium]